MKKNVIAIALLASMLLLTACGGGTETAGSAENPAAETTVAEETAQTDAETTAETEAETEAETTEHATTQAEAETEAMNGAANSDVATIAGDWYIDGDPMQGSLHIEPDGTFKQYHAGGVIENTGSIIYETEDVEDTTIGWFHLYNTDGEYVMGFVDDGSDSKTDLYVGNGADPHYIKFGAGGAADDGRGPGEEFVGTWGCGRATLEITQMTDTEFHALVSWSSSAAAHVEWDYPLTYENGRLVCDGKCTKTYIEYASADADPDETVEYTDGSAEFVMQGAGIVWNDLTEHSADDMVFVGG